MDYKNQSTLTSGHISEYLKSKKYIFEFVLNGKAQKVTIIHFDEERATAEFDSVYKFDELISIKIIF